MRATTIGKRHGSDHVVMPTQKPSVPASEPGVETCTQRRPLEPCGVAIGLPNDSYCAELTRGFAERGFSVRHFTSGKLLIGELRAQPAALVVLELRLVDGPTTEIIDWLRKMDVPVIVITQFASIASAVRCARLGVRAFYPRRATVDELLGSEAAESPESIPADRPVRLDRAMWEYLHRALYRAGSITTAAKLLQLDRRSLRRMLGKHAPPV